MKKILLFLIILILPSIITAFVLYRLYPKDFLFLWNTSKEKMVIKYPWLNKYLQVMRPPVKKEEPPPKKEKPIVVNLIHFTNAEVYAPICGKNIAENFSELFSGCHFCPKYLNSESNDKRFEYFSETRGKIFKSNEDEAIVFMKGCSVSNNNGQAIVIRKGYGGWQRQAFFDGVIFDKIPLEFLDSQGFFVFISRRTLITNDYVKQELIQVKFREKELQQRVLFTSTMGRGMNCIRKLQDSYEYPEKKNDKTFQITLEVVGCHETKLQGAFKMVFNLNDDDFKPNKETASIMTKIEKYGEIK